MPGKRLRSLQGWMKSAGRRSFRTSILVFPAFLGNEINLLYYNGLRAVAQRLEHSMAFFSAFFSAFFLAFPYRRGCFVLCYYVIPEHHDVKNKLKKDKKTNIDAYLLIYTCHESKSPLPLHLNRSIILIVFVPFSYVQCGFDLKKSVKEDAHEPRHSRNAASFP